MQETLVCGFDPGSGRSPGGGNGDSLQYSCLENPMDRRAWQAAVDVVARIGHDLATESPPPPCSCYHFVNCFGLAPFCSLPLLFSSTVIFLTNFSVVVRFLFLFCVCTYCRFLVCTYHEILI